MKNTGSKEKGKPQKIGEMSADLLSQSAPVDLKNNRLLKMNTQNVSKRSLNLGGNENSVIEEGTSSGQSPDRAVSSVPMTHGLANRHKNSNPFLEVTYQNSGDLRRTM